MSGRFRNAAIAVIATIVGLPAAARAGSSLPLLCGDNQHAIVQAPGSARQYQIRNPYWGAAGEACIVGTGGAGFRLTRTPYPNGRVTAYPDILSGCIWSICSPHSNLPMQVNHIAVARSAWHTWQATPTGQIVPGTWNASYDLWFGKRAMTTGRANGAELMIWLNHRGGCCFLAQNARRIWIDGIAFIVTHWRAYDPRCRTGWNYIQFRMVHPRWKVDGLNLLPFIYASERMNLINPLWWLETVEGGFEIWSGGRGLATTYFNVDIHNEGFVGTS